MLLSCGEQEYSAVSFQNLSEVNTVLWNILKSFFSNINQLSNDDSFWGKLMGKKHCQDTEETKIGVSPTRIDYVLWLLPWNFHRCPSLVTALNRSCSFRFGVMQNDLATMVRPLLAVTKWQFFRGGSINLSSGERRERSGAMGIHIPYWMRS